jgi:hypothetical protein
MPLSEAAIAHRKEQARAHYHKTKAARKIQVREWYLRNKEKRLAASRKWQQANRERINAHRRANPEKYRDQNKKWRHANRQQVLESSERCRIKKKYGITLEQYRDRIAAQDGKCEICKQPPSGKRSKSKLHLDHCHQTGKLRGFICGQCNTSLGMAKDSVAILAAMIVYLNKYAA